MPNTPPKLTRTVDELRAALAEVRRAGKTVGLVPTMGALHEGHLSLVRASKVECDFTVVTIFVNPSQFAPTEDLDSYPRTFEADMQALTTCGAELVFAPADEEVYCSGHDTWVEVGGVAEPLEGECRPAFFRGVATVVLKLFNMARADVAFFGQKDYQQAQVIKQMVRDLNVPIEIRVCPIVRAPDGLAMSSRNAYLSSEARVRALVLWRSLRLAQDLVAAGERDAKAITEKMREVILTVEDAQVNYVTLADPETLQPVSRITGPTVAALAVRIEGTRLIDNHILTPVEAI